MAQTIEQVREKLAARFGEAISAVMPAKDPFVVVKAERLLDVCRTLHDEPDLYFDFLQDETAVDYPKEHLLRVVYHLWSYKHGHGFKLKVELDRNNARVASVDSVWHAAGWLEREVFDLFGVHFEGHPDLRRIMMPDDWVGHPLRKDYQESGGYHEITNIRDNPLDLFLRLDGQTRAEAAAKHPPPAPVAPAAATPAAPKADAAT
jgi:NADH-quinone oxidoreductase subunit C